MTTKGAHIFAVAITVTTHGEKSRGGWSHVGEWLRTHPVTVSAGIGLLVAGVTFWWIGGPAWLLGRTIEASMAEPATAARVVETGLNLRSGLKQVGNAVGESRDQIAQLKVEMMQAHGGSTAELVQRMVRNDAELRAHMDLLLSVNTDLIATHYSVVQMAGVSLNLLLPDQQSTC